MPGLKLLFKEDEINIKFNIVELFPDKAVQSRENHEETSKKPNILQRFGTMLMMVPVAMQILSIPGALASIKMSLLKSFFVGKLALIIMIYNLFRSFRLNRELLVVHQQPAQYYNHYYAPPPNDDDDDDKGWFG
ncbi:hypothetical protein PV326_011163 [Microctonus aethiopoides]|uniref:Uncharacterized protein n=1 Tax=Microctonus aethiopoides TaxID=144406 RepID=A0AA39FAY5_9HYME|nr:hypothetical protein PV326_011163 [Microctonus aethiopoides]KAK0166203.1 hypothetical protein PV328_004644 [Microctonus aethiopoides]